MEESPASSDGGVLGKRKRAIGFVIGMAATIIYFMELGLFADDAHRRADRYYRRLNWSERVAFLYDDEFTRMYRVNKAGFNKLAVLIEPHVDLSYQKYLRRNVEPVSLELHLALTLRFLAGACIQDLWLQYGVSRSYCYDIIWKTVDAINIALDIKTDFSDIDTCARIAEGFAAKSTEGLFSHCIGAIDGIQIKIRCPGPHVKNRRSYFCRKGFYSLNVQAVCDSRRRFIDVDCSYPGSTSDSIAWLKTQVCREIEGRRIPDGFYFVGDAAYPCLQNMLTPVPGTSAEIGKWCDAYNFYQSQTRINIECAFGLLVRRWGILWKPLECAHRRNPSVVVCCMRLHNFCIDNGIGKAGVNPGDGCYTVGSTLISMRPRLDVVTGAPVGMLDATPIAASVMTATAVRRAQIIRVMESGNARPTPR